MRFFQKTVAVAFAAAAGLWVGGAMAAPFDFTATAASPRTIIVEGEGILGLSCQNPNGAPLGTLHYPNNVTATGLGGTGCTTFSKDPGATFADPRGHFAATATYIGPSGGGFIWQIDVAPAVYAGQINQTVLLSGAAVTAVNQALSYRIDTSLAGTAASVFPNPTLSACQFQAGGCLYDLDLSFGGTLPLALVANPIAADRPFWGQADNPLAPDAPLDRGIGLTGSCYGDPTPTNVATGCTAGAGSGGASLLAIGGASCTVSTDWNGAGGLKRTTYVYITSGASTGTTVDIIAVTTPTNSLTLAATPAVTIAPGTGFDVFQAASVFGPPRPGGPSGTGTDASACPAAIASPGYSVCAAGSCGAGRDGEQVVTGFAVSSTKALPNILFIPAGSASTVNNFAALDARLMESSGVDTDSDGVPDEVDNCPTVANPPVVPVGQADSDVDGRGDACDNCIAKKNFLPTTLDPSAVCVPQINTDGDAYGNICDGDFNNDGVVNGVDGGPFILALGTGTDPGNGTDMNCDGVVNGVDGGPFIQQLGQGVPGP